MIKPMEIAGNVAEWVAAWCFGAFGISFCKEFQKLSLNIQCIPKCSGKNSDALKYSTIPVTGADENTTDSEWRHVSYVVSPLASLTSGKLTISNDI